ncbi:hypothetical protein L9F63_007963 [Diploptera punctata]|uniref:Uncharacterized protein n=1 Tax=Diploptera punctata TaxID=6984 RepID=A0AAD7Z7E8_DIPPU|nr:hypothetical protein L9F63_007963 [Diploptera punctata]
MFKIVEDNVLEVSENENGCSGLYDIFKEEISELGDSSTDWWRERSDLNNRTIFGSQSPVFKTPQLSLQTRKNRRSCMGSSVLSSGQKRSRVISPVGVEPLECFSPFKTSRLSPITPTASSVPESLEALLHDGSEISWSSAFATPLTSNVTCSRLGTEEKKLLIPCSASKNLRVLFSPQCEQVDQDSNTSQHSVQDPTVLFENSDVADKYDTLCYSTPSHKKVCSRTYIVNRTQDSNNEDLLLPQSEKKSNQDDTSDLKFQRNNLSNQKKLRTLGRKNRKCRLVMSPDSGLNEFTANSIDVDLGMSSPLGDARSKEVTDTKLSDSLNLLECRQSSPLPVIDSIDCSEINKVSYSDVEKTQDFPHDLSFNTLEEICQATEILVANADSEIECSDERSSVCHQLYTQNRTCMSRTSTPKIRVEKKSKLDTDTKKKKIKFVQVSTNDSASFSERLTNTVKINGYDKQVNKNDSSSDLLPEVQNVSINGNTSNYMSKIQMIKSTANKVKKFIYVPSETNLKATLVKKDEKVMIDDIVGSAYALESAVESKNDAHNKQIKKSIKNNSGLLSFRKLQTVLQSVDSMEELNVDNNRIGMLTLDDCDKNMGTSTTNITRSTATKPVNNMINISHRSIGHLERNNSFTSAVESGSKFLSNSERFTGNNLTSSDKTRETCDNVVKNVENCIEDTNLNVFSSDIKEISSVERIDTSVNDTKGKKFKENVKHTNRFINENIESVFSLMELKSDHNETMTDSQMVQIAEHAELMQQFSEDDSVFTQWPHGTMISKKRNDKCFDISKTNIKNTEIELEESSRTKAVLSMAYSREVGKANLVLQKLHSKNLQKQLSSNSEENETCKFPIAEEINVKICDNTAVDVDEILNSSVIRHFLNEGAEKDFLEISSVNGIVTNTINDKSSKIVKNNEETVKSQVRDENNSLKLLISNDNEASFNTLASLKSEKENVPIFENSRVEMKSEIPLAVEPSVKSKDEASCNEEFEREPLKVKDINKKTLFRLPENKFCIKSHNAIEKPLNTIVLESTKRQTQSNENSELKELLHINYFNENRSASAFAETLSEAEINFSEENIVEPCISDDGKKENVTSNISENYVNEQKEKTNDLSGVTYMCPEDNTGNENSNVGNVSDESEFPIKDKALQIKSNYCVLDKCLPQKENIKKDKMLELKGFVRSSKKKADNIYYDSELSSSNTENDRNNSSVGMNEDKSAVHISKLQDSLLESEEKENLEGALSNFENVFIKEVFEKELAESTKCNSKLQEFSNASGKKISVSEKDLNDAKILFSNDMFENDSSKGNVMSLMKPNKTISEVQIFLKPNEENVILDLVEKELAENPKCTSEIQGFSTASGKKISVSEKALNNAKILFSNEMIENDLSKEINVMSHMKPDKTISELETIVKPNEENIFLGKVFENKLAESAKCTLKFQGFSTASGKKISVSEKALNDAKILFSNEMNENDLSEDEINVMSLTKHDESISELPTFVKPNEEKSLGVEKSSNNISVGFSEAISDTKIETSLIKKPNTIDLPIYQQFTIEKEVKIPDSGNTLKTLSLMFSEDVISEEQTCDNIILPPGNSKTYNLTSQISMDVSNEILHMEDLNKNRFSICKSKIENNEVIAILPYKQVTKNNFHTILSQDAGLEKSKFSEEEQRSAEFKCTDNLLSMSCKTDYHKGDVSNNLPFKKQTISKTEINGFTTASGKIINISENALNKVKIMFTEDEFDLELINKSKVGELEFPGNSKEIITSQEALNRIFLEEFTCNSMTIVENTSTVNSPVRSQEMLKFQALPTNSNKDVSVPDNVLKDIEHIYSEKCAFDKETNIETIMTSTGKQMPESSGSSTARDKKIPVSENIISDNGLNAAKLLFSEEDFATKTAPLCTSKQMAKFQGFSTANGKQILVSEDALNRAKLLFSEEHEKSTLENSLPSTSRQIAKFQDFSALSGRQVSVSENVINSTKSLFSEVSKKSVTLTSKKSTEFRDFSTASDKEVTISENSLNKSKILYSKETEKVDFDSKSSLIGKQMAKFQVSSTASDKEVLVSEDAVNRAKLLIFEEGKNATSLLSTNKQSAKFQGFSTASGREIQVSEDALNRAKLLFSEEGENTAAVPSTSKQISKLQSFSTANGKDVPILDEALNRAKLLIPEEGEKTTSMIFKSEESVTFQGFSTASGKEVPVSEEALIRAKLIFSEEGENTTAVPSISKQTSKFQGFSTASGKKVPISEEALNRAKLLFSEEGENTTAVPSTSKQTSKFQGFTTAGGKEVSVSEEALNRAKLLFSEEGENTTAMPSMSKQTSKFQGFSTASGKDVVISDEALNRAKLLFSEEGDNTTAVPSTSKQTSKFQGFTTAGGKEVSVSEEALNRAKLLFSEEGENTTTMPSMSKQTSKFQGFSTASGKDVVISDEALNRAKLLFSEEGDNITVVPSTSKQTSKFQGFSTASGKKVPISEEALNRAKLLFSEEGENTTAMPSMSKQTSKFQGFSTASGKDVVILDEALNRAKLLFSEEGDNITVVPSTSKQTSKFQGFSTAGGKEVSVSEEALNRAKLLFSEEGENTTAMPSPSASKQTSKFQGFTTAGGREVSVSQEALNRAKLLFSEEVENITAVPSTSKQTSKFQGFSTSSGKEVAISDEALNRAKLLFSEKEEKTTAMASTSKQTSKFQDFSTDSDKEVSVSENALNKAKILFSGTEFDDKIFGNKLKTYKSKLQKFTELNSNMNSLDIALLSQDVINEFSKNELCTSWVSENISDSCDLKITKSKHDAENSNKKNLHINSDEESLDSPKINEINHNFIEDLTSFDETELSLSPVLKSSLTSRKVKHISAKKQIKNRLSLSRKNKLKHSDLNKSCIVKNDINMNKTGEETSMKHSVVEKVAEDNGENYCNRKKRDALVTLTQEVQESAAALLADEDMFDASLWSYISCPDMVYDHPCAPAAVVCSEESVTRADDTGTCSSPVLGGGDRRKKRSKFSQNSNCSSLKAKFSKDEVIKF